MNQSSRYVVQLHGIEVSHGLGQDKFTLSISNFDIQEKDLIVVVGDSGSGKSTLLELIGLLISPEKADHFSLLLQQKSIDITSLWRDKKTTRLAQIRSSSIGYIMQHGGLLPYLDVWNNIMVSASLSNNIDHSYAKDICEQLGISLLLKRYPKQLSVGQRQRVAIVRALVHKPKLILADEPTSSLDKKNAYKVMELLTNLCKQTETALLCASHSLELTKKFDLETVYCINHSGNKSGLQV